MNAIKDDSTSMCDTVRSRPPGADPFEHGAYLTDPTGANRAIRASDLFQHPLVPLDGFTARAGIPPDSFLAAPIRIPRRGWIRGATPLDAAAPGAVSSPGTLPAFGGSRVANRRRSDTRSADVSPRRVPGGGEAGR